ESLMERLGTLARGQGLDGLGIEHGVVEDLMADVEHRRLADEQNSRVRGKNSVDGGQGGIEPAGYIPAEEGQVPRPLVETGQAVEQSVKLQTRAIARIVPRRILHDQRSDQSAPSPARMARQGSKGSQNRSS